MIIGIEGLVEKKEPTCIHLNVNGLIYEVFVSVNTSSDITTKQIKLHTTHIIREDAQLLFGFMDQNEKVMFDSLLKINGVGPKVALAICSTFTPMTFSQIVQSNDVNGLKRVPGIGPKSAGRILVELSGFSLELTKDEQSSISVNNDAVLALQSLGFKKDVISKVLKSCTQTETGALVKEALQKLQK